MGLEDRKRRRRERRGDAKEAKQRKQKEREEQSTRNRKKVFLPEEADNYLEELKRIPNEELRWIYPNNWSPSDPHEALVYAAMRRDFELIDKLSSMAKKWGVTIKSLRSTQTRRLADVKALSDALIAEFHGWITRINTLWPSSNVFLGYDFEHSHEAFNCGLILSGVDFPFECLPQNERMSAGFVVQLIWHRQLLKFLLHTNIQIPQTVEIELLLYDITQRDENEKYCQHCTTNITQYRQFPNWLHLMEKKVKRALIFHYLQLQTMPVQHPMADLDLERSESDDDDELQRIS
eukprot:TRINITY_DN66941_c2_g5_i1.p1 TRINITY_DN66941_c2_g5~~TRINITY_DN66941_c2_g5_i1.p1  ORF type:complete len:292 (-),score=4.46 TRINITY_DN66941_c2_g5_i1:137-1012(-)